MHSNEVKLFFYRIRFVSKIVSLTVASIKDGDKLKKPVRLEFKKEQVILSFRYSPSHLRSSKDAPISEQESLKIEFERSSWVVILVDIITNQIGLRL